MEWALDISNYRRLKQLEDPWWESTMAKIPQLQQSIEDSKVQPRLTRLYFGQEFCERLLPTFGDLVKALQEANGRKLDFTFVTPYVTEKGLANLKKLFERLVVLKPDCEVVVNDWGVLQLLKINFPSLTPVLGRLLNKIWRDPRMSDYVQQDNVDLFQTCSFAGKPMQDLLSQYEVGRIELDNPPQGLDPSLARWGFTVSLYLPYGYITTGRMCLLGSWGSPTADKFKATAKTCSHACQRVWLDMVDHSGQVAKNPNWTIVQKGNTVFYKQNAKFMTASLHQLNSFGIDRIVIQTDPV